MKIKKTKKKRKSTNKYNIYKIIFTQKDQLAQKLEKVGLDRVYSENNSDFQMEFYFSREPDEIDIWWTQLYRDFLKDLNTSPKNKSFFGVLLIYNSEICYAVSLGKTHFYLKKYADSDFGLDLAERIIDQSNLKIKNSKYYKSQKSKTITAYQAKTNFAYDTGESMHYIKSKTINPILWGKTASFGTSVQLSLDIEPDSLPDTIQEIESKLKEEPLLRLPRVSLVHDENQKTKLDSRLNTAIINTEHASVEFEEISLSGIDFVFIDSERYRFFKKGEKRHTLTEEKNLSLEEVQNFMFEQEINDVNQVMVSIERETGKSYAKSIKEILDYIDPDRYCLIDGKWHQFNKSYIDFLNREVDSIELQHQDSKFNILKSVEKKGIKGPSENDFNNNLQENEGYVNVDKKMTQIDSKYKIEKMDLYKEETLFFVKKGTPQKLGYVVDQSINTINLLQNNESKIQIEGESKSIKSICLWLIIDRKTDIEKLSDLNSIIFSMKLTEWKKKAIDAGLKPVIYVSYMR